MSKLKASFEEIIGAGLRPNASGKLISTSDLMLLAATETFSSAINDSRKRLLILIDMQNDFMPGGALGVNGADNDSISICRFIYRNMYGITRILPTFDFHPKHMISFPCTWMDGKGNNPPPFTRITTKEIDGIYEPVYGNSESQAKFKKYVNKLEEINETKYKNTPSLKKFLTIWPYHCIMGTPGQSMEAQLANMVNFHSIVRDVEPLYSFKGTDPFSEMYGVLRPEYSETGKVNTTVINAFEDYDEVYVAGEAADYCVLESLYQIFEQYESRPDITKKIHILIDCTSSIGNMDDTLKAYEFFAQTYGAKLVKSTDIQF